MSIFKRTSDGKIRIDWSTFITLIISLLISGTVTGFGTYYGVKYDLAQQAYRLGEVEEKTKSLSMAVATLQIKDATDGEAIKNLCAHLSEMKDYLREIRGDQKRRQRAD